MIAGSRDIVRKWGDWETISLSQASEIATRLDAYMHETGTFPTGKTRRFNPATGQVEWNGEIEATHVWHCSLSLSPEEAALGDEVWGRIASDFMDEMGLHRVRRKSAVPVGRDPSWECEKRWRPHPHRGHHRA